jgi:hypothetical protein
MNIHASYAVPDKDKNGNKIKNVRTGENYLSERLLKSNADPSISVMPNSIFGPDEIYLATRFSEGIVIFDSLENAFGCSTFGLDC